MEGQGAQGFDGIMASINGGIEEEKNKL